VLEEAISSGEARDLSPDRQYLILIAQESAGKSSLHFADKEMVRAGAKAAASVSSILYILNEQGVIEQISIGTGVQCAGDNSPDHGQFPQQIVKAQAIVETR
jgi:hypothetical protein